MKILAQPLITAAFSCALLTACGGNDNDDPPLATGDTVRGTLKIVPQVIKEFKSSDIDAVSRAIGLQSLVGRARCDVRIVSLDYNTIGVKADATNASGVLLVPAGACALEPKPLLSYSRGTSLDRSKTLASPDDPETLLMIAAFASQGYAVVATDYLGYGRSTYEFHPYLHAESEATSVIDAIRAARAAAPGQSLQLSGKVMLTGYSQGGHASAAAQRAIEASLSSEINVVAAAHLAGPYNLSGSLREPDPFNSYQFLVTFLVTSWQKIYRDIYSSPSEVFKAPYAGTVENLLPGPGATPKTLVDKGALPGGTPAQARDALIQPAYLAAIRTNDNNALVRAARSNDLLSWQPRAKTLLCGGSGDPTVPYKVHQLPALDSFRKQGLTSVTSVDVDPQIRDTFAPDKTVPTDPGSDAYATYFNNYHPIYQTPFCLAQAKNFFESAR